jgi:hypothetical protein
MKAMRDRLAGDDDSRMEISPKNPRGKVRFGRPIISDAERGASFRFPAGVDFQTYFAGQAAGFVGAAWPG